MAFKLSGVVKAVYKVDALSYSDALIPIRDIPLIISYLNTSVLESDVQRVLVNLKRFISGKNPLNIQVG